MKNSASLGVAAVLALMPGCQNFGRGILLTVVAPSKQSGPATALLMARDSEAPIPVSKPDGTGFFADARAEKFFLEVPSAPAMTVEVRANWGDDWYARKEAVSVIAGTVALTIELEGYENNDAAVGLTDLAAPADGASEMLSHEDMPPDLKPPPADMTCLADQACAMQCPIVDLGCSDMAGWCWRHNNGLRDYFTCEQATSAKAACEAEAGPDMCSFVGAYDVCPNSTWTNRAETHWCDDGRWGPMCNNLLEKHY